MQIPASETTRRVLDLKSINAEAAADAAKRKAATQAIEGQAASSKLLESESTVGTVLDAKA